MKAKQAAYFNMIEACISTAESNKAAWSNVAGFVKAYSAITESLMPQLINAMATSSSATQPATLAKAALRKKIEGQTIRLGLAISAYACTIADEELAGDSFLTRSDLSRQSDSGMISMTARIMALSQTVPFEHLAFWGINDKELQQLADGTIDFIEICSHPRRRRAQIREANQTCNRILGEIMDLIEGQMDKAVQIMESAQPKFYSLWQTARKVVHPATHTRALEIKVIEAGTGKALPNAIIRIDDRIVKSTTAKGNARMEHFSAGSHAAAISRTGFITKIVSFSVGSGETTKLVVDLEQET